MTNDDHRRKRARDLLHAYELGMITDQEREELELYVLETGEFLDELKAFRPAIRLVRGDRDVRETVGDISKAQSNPADSEDRKRSWWRSVVPGVVAVAAVILMLVLVDWEIVIKPRQEAVASENRLAVMYIENLVDAGDSAQLGKIATNLLITDLSQSQYLQVVSSQRLQDILRLMGHEGTPVVEADMATQVAREADARWMLTGSIVQTDPMFVVSVQIVEVATGDVVVSDRVVSDSGDNIFSVVDRVTVQVKNNLGLPSGALGEVDRQVADVTSHSAEAYRHYLLGLDYYYKYYFFDAIPEFERVLEYDSTFAMAYYYLGTLYDSRLIKKAVEYIDQASDRDRYLIRARMKGKPESEESGSDETPDETGWRRSARVLREALERYPDDKQLLLVLGQHYHSYGLFDSAIVCFRRAIEIDPYYKSAHNSLAYAYSERGDLDSALALIEMYIEVAPGEANPYDSRGDIYRWNGMLDEAVESYRQAVEIKEDYFPSWEKLGDLLICRGELQSADSCFHRLLAANNLVTRSKGRYLVSLVPMALGRFTAARELLKHGLRADSLDVAATGQPVDKATKYLILSRMDEALGLTDSAVANMNRGFECCETMSSYLHLYIQLLAEAGDFDMISSEMKYLRVADTATRPGLRAKLHYAEGAVAFVRGEYQDALEFFREADSYMPDVPATYMIGRTLLELGKADEAIEAFDRLTSGVLYCAPHFGPWSVQAHYYIGVAHEQAERYAEAAAAYRGFLDQWSTADPDIPSLIDARERLDRISSRL